MLLDQNHPPRSYPSSSLLTQVVGINKVLPSSVSVPPLNTWLLPQTDEPIALSEKSDESVLHDVDTSSSINSDATNLSVSAASGVS